MPIPGQVRLAGLVLTLASGIAAAAPAPGRYDGELCVAVGAQAPNCGKAVLQVEPRGLASARVDDIVYRFQIVGAQVAVLLTQGAGQLDEFVGAGGWVGNDLRFVDNAKNVRYELKFGPRRLR